ncbi:hypothetical protein [Azohydromonas aeria]|uniref:hypothetical protein n=1 Tax=Azohydromonas aeria TaxID=2590212 RepID=UPI0012F8FDD7|nr:hypothetical protein [Azohydromonas aeria]
MIEHVERRVFGAIEFLDDVTGARVLAPLSVAGPGLRIVPNHGGLYVLRAWAGHDDYTRAFDGAPADPPRSEVALSVHDPARRYLPRAFSLALPRRLPTPGQPVPDADNALRPVPVRLAPAPALPLRGSWAVLRLQVVADGSTPPLGLANVLVEATPAVAGLAVQRTLTDTRGEALVAIAGVPPLLPDPGPSGLTREFGLALRLVLDRAVVRTSAEAADSNLPLADPDLIARRLAAADPAVRAVAADAPPHLSAGTSRRFQARVTWP